MPRRHLPGIIAVAVGIVLAAAGCTLPTSGDGEGYGPRKLAAAGPDAAGVAVNLRSGARQKLAGENFSWNPARYIAAPGARIVLDVVNDDPSQHNFTLAGLELSRNVPAGGHTLVRFTAPKPGRYRFYCKYQREEMQGWLTVK